LALHLGQPAPQRADDFGAFFVIVEVMREIVQEGDEVLRATAAPVPQEEFGGKKLAELLRDMAAALDVEPDGVALAAPQVGVSWQLFIVRMDRVEPQKTPEGLEIPPGEQQAVVEAYINPQITKTSRRRQRADEGCLSVRGIYGTTTRHERVTIRAQRADGSTFTRGAGGLLAQIFEHEMDHLNGVLFIDAAEDMVEISTPPEATKSTENHELA
jgi:peptide deformylase